MKRFFVECPKTIDERELYGFSWMEHVLAIPSPLVVVTGYKANGKPNATLQSWCTFVSENGFFCIFGSVNKRGHMYESVKRSGCLVINFPSADIYAKCLDTIENNGAEDDEIALSGLTAEPTELVAAPRIKECFLNLECEYAWEKEITEGSGYVALCVRVLGVCMDEERYNSQKAGRYGNTGYLYNVHSPRNPESGEEEETFIAALKKVASYEELRREAEKS